VFQVAVPEVGQRWLAANGGSVLCGRHETIVPDEGHDIDARLEREQALR
jgi:hypothetical protein